MNKQELKMKVDFWKSGCIVFIIAFIFLMWLSLFIVNKQTASYKQGFQDGQANATLNNGINMLNFTDTLELINNNCGSVFFTKNYGQTEFSIFAQKCLGDGFCKPAYKTIEECLK